MPSIGRRDEIPIVPKQSSMSQIACAKKVAKILRHKQLQRMKAAVALASGSSIQKSN